LPPFEPITSQPLAPVPTPVPELLTQAYRTGVVMDNDLETTMKRPAVKLQQIPAGAQGKPERKLPEPVSSDKNLTSHDRLVRAYQFQLAGSYEDSMNEYKLIIKNAPELMEDVIGNLRALIKINPRFSPGYRVLGDAYMRKGEYLQAMEAYNQALTMAKKGK
jgi:tetratricopeptide (TPR) repeat protein